MDCNTSTPEIRPGTRTSQCPCSSAWGTALEPHHRSSTSRDCTTEFRCHPCRWRYTASYQTHQKEDIHRANQKKDIKNQSERRHTKNQSGRRHQEAIRKKTYKQPIDIKNQSERRHTKNQSGRRHTKNQSEIRTCRVGNSGRSKSALPPQTTPGPSRPMASTI